MDDERIEKLEKALLEARAEVSHLQGIVEDLEEIVRGDRVHLRIMAHTLATMGSEDFRYWQDMFID